MVPLIITLSQWEFVVTMVIFFSVSKIDEEATCEFQFAHWKKKRLLIQQTWF